MPDVQQRIGEEGNHDCLTSDNGSIPMPSLRREMEGIGAGAGAVIGAVISGKSGAAKGAAIGGAAGTGAVRAARGKEARLEPGADIPVRLAAPLAIRVRVQ